MSAKNKSSRPSSSSEVADLLSELCSLLAGDGKEKAYRYTIKFLNSFPEVIDSDLDDMSLFEEIKQSISIVKSKEEAELYQGLHEKLFNNTALKRKKEILRFLWSLSEQESPGITSNLLGCMGTNLKKISNSRPQSTNINKSSNSRPQSSNSVKVEHLYKAPTIKNSNSDGMVLAVQSLAPSSSVNNYLEPTLRNKDNSSNLYTDNVSEDKLVQELVYCFQGVEGQVLKREAGGGFYIEPRSKLRRTHFRSVLRLAELGYLHDKVKQYIDIDSGMAPLGLVGQGFISELRKELTEYYRMVAVLHEQVRKNISFGDYSMDVSRRNDPVTLLKLSCWVRSPMHRLKWLCNIAKACEGRKGGALASIVYAFLWHGDPRVSNLANQVLSAACGPLYTMLTDWLLDGEIKDPSQEFFIEAVPNVSGDRLWHQKYRVRVNMLPDFLSIEQAERVLATGKCINFLREVCQDSLPLEGREALKRVLHSSSVKSLYENGKDSILHSVMDTAYRDASRRVLDTLMGKHKLLDHLQALRRYLLLGQGDFIRHLMELLDPELTKPASLLFRHNMCSMLESAIRATNAQFDDPDILDRLDVKLIESSAGDTGWDIFSLQYHVQGPIGTVFESTEDEYLILFNSLWKSKRMEYILSRLWREQMTSTRCLQSMTKLRPIMQQLHILTSEMVHFIHQIQYYILFEVLECSWAILIEQVNKAESLDDVLTAHQVFLRTVQTGAMYSGTGNNLQTLYTPIVELQRLQTEIYAAAFRELKAQRDFIERIESSAKTGEYGVTNEQRFNRDKEKKDFEHFIDLRKEKLNGISSIFGSSCKNFLLMLSLSDNVNLQLLSNRLDFNGYYKRSDLRLNAPLTYQYKRMSLLNAIVSNSKINSQRTKVK